MFKRIFITTAFCSLLGSQVRAASSGPLWFAYTDAAGEVVEDRLYQFTENAFTGTLFVATVAPLEGSTLYQLNVGTNTEGTTQPTVPVASSLWDGSRSLGTIPASDGATLRVLTLADREAETLQQRESETLHQVGAVVIAFMCWWTFRDSFWRRSTQM